MSEGTLRDVFSERDKARLRSEQAETFSVGDQIYERPVWVMGAGDTPLKVAQTIYPEEDARTLVDYLMELNPDVDPKAMDVGDKLFLAPDYPFPPPGDAGPPHPQIQYIKVMGDSVTPYDARDFQRMEESEQGQRVLRQMQHPRVPRWMKEAFYSLPYLEQTIPGGVSPEVVDMMLEASEKANDPDSVKLFQQLYDSVRNAAGPQE